MLNQIKKLIQSHCWGVRGDPRLLILMELGWLGEDGDLICVDIQ